MSSLTSSSLGVPGADTSRSASRSDIDSAVPCRSASGSWSIGARAPSGLRRARSVRSSAPSICRIRRHPRHRPLLTHAGPARKSELRAGEPCSHCAGKPCARATAAASRGTISPSSISATRSRVASRCGLECGGAGARPCERTLWRHGRRNDAFIRQRLPVQRLDRRQRLASERHDRAQREQQPATCTHPCPKTGQQRQTLPLRSDRFADQEKILYQTSDSPTGNAAAVPRRQLSACCSAAMR